jgi:hypothetical protein
MPYVLPESSGERQRAGEGEGGDTSSRGKGGSRNGGEVSRNARWRAAHKESYNAYMKTYMARRRQGV